MIEERHARFLLSAVELKDQIAHADHLKRTGKLALAWEFYEVTPTANGSMVRNGWC